MNDCMDKQTAINLLDNLIGMVDDSQESDYDTALKMGIEALKAWDCGIGFDHIRDIHFCPKCGRRLPNFEICDKVRKE